MAEPALSVNDPDAPLTGTPPVIAPGHTFGSVTDKISSIVLSRRTSIGWYLGFLTAAALTVLLLVSLSYLTVIPFFRPLVVAVSKLRFLGLTGLVFPFTLLTGGGYALKVALLTFGMTTFYVTAMSQIVMEIPREQFDHLRVLGAGEWRILWEVVVRGTLDRALDTTRQNLAIGWAMITMVEGISRAEGGIGALILNQNKHFHLAEVYAVLIAILGLGLLLDYAMGVLVRVLCPHVLFERVAR